MFQSGKMVILISCLCLSSMGSYSLGTKSFVNFRKTNIVSEKKASSNGAKIINFIKKKSKLDYGLPLNKLKKNVEYMSDDSEDEDDFHTRDPNFDDEFFELTKFYRSVSHNLSSRRTPLICKNKFQHHILSRLYEMIKPIYESKSDVPTSYSFIIPSPFGNLILVLQRCNKDDKHSFYLENDIEKFYAFQTFVSYGRLKSDYISLENRFNSMNFYKRKEAINIIYDYLNLKCYGFDFKTKIFCSETGQNCKMIECINQDFIKLSHFAKKIFNKKELSCLRTITAILGFSEPLRIHDGGKTMRSLIRYNKIILNM